MNWGVHGIWGTLWQLSWLLVPLYAIGLYVAQKKRRRDVRRFGEPRLVYSAVTDEIWKTEEDANLARAANPEKRMQVIRNALRRRQNTKNVLVFLAMLMLLTALGRPQWGTRQEVIHHAGIDLVICVDTSYSMNAQDVAPNRISAASNLIRTLLSELDGNRIGLVSFASTTRIHSPLTLDYRVIQSILDYSLSMGPGTDIEAAVDAALRVLDASDSNTRGILVVSDGEDHGGSIDKAIQKARAANVTIFALGVGTHEGSPIPEDGSGAGYMRYSGELVWTKLEEDVLKKMTHATGGRYYRVTPALGEAAELAQDIRRMEKTEFSQAIRTHREDQFGIFLILAVLFLSVETIMFRLGILRWEAFDEAI